MLQPLLDYVSQKNSVELLGPGDANHRAATVSLVCNAPAREVATRLASQGIMAGCGHFYGKRLLAAMGKDADHGVLRLSFIHTATRAEVDLAIQALDTVL